MRYLCVLFTLLLSTANAATSDAGKISQLYVDNSKNVAILLDGGFPNAKAGNECATSNDWAGVTIDAPELKAALLAANASKANVVVNISGCTAGGSWFKLISVYID